MTIGASDSAPAEPHVLAGAHLGRASGWPPVLAAAVAAAFSVAVFAPLLGAYFRDDDFRHLFEMANYDLLTVLTIPHGNHVYVVRNLLFAACWRAFGMEPAGYYAVALAVHALNVVLLFAAIRRLTRSTTWATFGAALWGTCPVHAGVLEWFSVVGHALAATAFLIILVGLSGCVARTREPTRAQLWTWAVVGLAGTTCFGVGIGVAMALPWIVAAFLAGRYAWRRPPLIVLPALVPLVYVGLLGLHAYLAAPGWRADGLPTYVTLAWIVRIPLATWELATYGLARLLCGLECVGSVASIPPGLRNGLFVVVLALLAAVARWSKPTRGVLLGCALAALASYGVIAAGRSMLLLHDAILQRSARYQYLALLPVTIALCIGLAAAAERSVSARRLGRVGVLLWFAGSITAALQAPPWLNLAPTHRAEARRFVEEIEAATAMPGRDPVYFRNRAIPSLHIPTPAFPGRAAAFVLYFPTGEAGGHPVYFVERDPAQLAIAASASRLRGVLIAREAVPPGVRIR